MLQYLQVNKVLFIRNLFPRWKLTTKNVSVTLLVLDIFCCGEEVLLGRLCWPELAVPEELVLEAGSDEELLGDVLDSGGLHD